MATYDFFKVISKSNDGYKKSIYYLNTGKKLLRQGKPIQDFIIYLENSERCIKESIEELDHIRNFQPHIPLD